jgi:DNA-binding transcriptional LysR family regulator
MVGLGALAVVGLDMREHDAAPAVDDVGRRQRKLSDGFIDLIEQGIDVAVRIGLLPADLLAHTCIVYTGLATRNAWTLVTPDGSQVTVRVPAAFQTNSSEGVRAATLAGLGITYSPHFLFAGALARGDVVRLLPDWSAPPLPIHLLCTPERRGAAKVRAFGDHLAAAWGDPGALSAAPARSLRRRAPAQR